MHVFFDLDGTLTDSCPGIIRCINHGLTTLGTPAADETYVRSLIGAPLGAIFATLLGADDRRTIDRAIAAYRERFFRAGLFENSLYDGVADALAHLAEAGHRLQIVTAKPTHAAEKVLAHFGIARFFQAVHGSDPAEIACDKADLVAAALRHGAATAGEAVMVGDRVEDIHAAQAHGVRAIAASWGYGARPDLDAAGPDYVAENIGDVVRWLK